MALFEKKIIHRDFKPSNIFISYVDDDNADGSLIGKIYSSEEDKKIEKSETNKK